MLLTRGTDLAGEIEDLKNSQTDEFGCDFNRLPVRRFFATDFNGLSVRQGHPQTDEFGSFDTDFKGLSVRRDRPQLARRPSDSQTDLWIFHRSSHHHHPPRSSCRLPLPPAAAAYGTA
jgi:hypothetical protein